MISKTNERISTLGFVAAYMGNMKSTLMEQFFGRRVAHMKGLLKRTSELLS